MRNPGGYGVVISPVPTPVWFDAGRRREFAPNGVLETDTYRCGHCPRQTTVQPFTDPADVGALCKKCMKVVCRSCVIKGRSTGTVSCDPLEAKMEREEKQERKSRVLR